MLLQLGQRVRLQAKIPFIDAINPARFPIKHISTTCCAARNRKSSTRSFFLLRATLLKISRIDHIVYFRADRFGKRLLHTFSFPMHAGNRCGSPSRQLFSNQSIDTQCVAPACSSWSAVALAAAARAPSCCRRRARRPGLARPATTAAAESRTRAAAPAARPAVAATPDSHMANNRHNIHPKTGARAAKIERQPIQPKSRPFKTSRSRSGRQTSPTLTCPTPRLIRRNIMNGKEKFRASRGPVSSPPRATSPA